MPWVRTRVAVLTAVLIVGRVCAADTRWDEIETAAQEMRAREAEIKLHDVAIEAHRAGMARRLGGDLAAKHLAVEQAEKEAAKAQSDAGLDPLLDSLQKARAARDGQVGTLLADAPTYQAAKRRQEELRQRTADLENRIETLTAGDVLELARLKTEAQFLGKRLNGAVRAWWRRGEVAPLFKAADEAFSAVGAQIWQSKSVNSTPNWRPWRNR